MKVKIRFDTKLSACDPAQRNIVIVGQVPHLCLVPWDVVSVKLSPRVEKQTFDQALSAMNPSHSDACTLFFNSVVLASLPSKCSRHNTPSQCHALTKVLKGSTLNEQLDIVMVCDRKDVFAAAAAITRAFPIYSRKSSWSARPEGIVNVEFVLVSGEQLTKEDLKCLEDVAEGIQLASRIVDTPCCEMNTMHFLNEIEQVSSLLRGVKLTVIKGEELNDQGFGGLYAVGKAAENPPALAILSHSPPGATQNVAWVGKGIVYDTGGLSIKSKTGMPGMKRDCGGAAAVLGAFLVAVRQGFRENLHGVFCLAENAVGPRSTKPDDIITMYSGRTVEVNNTDAEGRLVLADGVCYASKVLKADVIVDVATLTGAQGPATGKYHGALITNDGTWEEAAVVAGRISGDLLHPLPYCPELHFAEFTSAVADMKNSVADRNNAQPSCAALFIAAHLGFETTTPWLHIDMAYPVVCGERATGYGVNLLSVLFGKYSNSHALRSLCPLIDADVEMNNGVEDANSFKKPRLS